MYTCIEPDRIPSMGSPRDAVAARIQQLLDENDWTPYELSKRAGLSDSHIGLVLKRGTSRTGAETLRRIAQGAGVSERWLMTGEGPKTPSAPSDVEVVPEESDPRMRNRAGYDGHLSAAMALRPQHPRYVWDALGNADPLLTVPLTPSLLADLADVLVKYIPAPPGHSPSRRG